MSIVNKSIMLNALNHDTDTETKFNDVCSYGIML